MSTAQTVPTLYARPRFVLERERHQAANRAMREAFKGHHYAARQWFQIVYDIDSELAQVRRAS